MRSAQEKENARDPVKMKEIGLFYQAYTPFVPFSDNTSNLNVHRYVTDKDVACTTYVSYSIFMGVVVALFALILEPSLHPYLGYSLIIGRAYFSIP